MPDITKCVADNCPIRYQCYRFTAPSDEYQSYFVDVPGGYETTLDRKLQWKCDMFWGVGSESIFNYLSDIVEGKKS